MLGYYFEMDSFLISYNSFIYITKKNRKIYNKGRKINIDKCIKISCKFLRSHDHGNAEDSFSLSIGLTTDMDEELIRTSKIYLSLSLSL
jgi:hypothetical protein